MASLAGTIYSANSRTPDPVGGDPFGKVPAATPTPNPYSDLSKVYPNLGATNAAVSGSILDQLSGQLSPETMRAIQDAGAQWGVSSGMPGSGLSTNRSLRNVGLTSIGQIQQGIQNYGSIIPAVSRTQTVDPALQAEISAQNNIYAAAPNPASAAQYAQSLFQEYMNKLNGPAGGTGGFDPATFPAGTRESAPGTYRTPAPFGSPFA